MAFHNTLGNVALFLGASLGGLLAVRLPTSLTLLEHTFIWSSVFFGVFLASAMFRLLIALFFLPHIAEVRSVRRMTYQGLIFRATRFSPISGVIFEIISRAKTKDDSK
jgi:hypothetical protein